MARVRITKPKNSRTHADVPFPFDMVTLYEAEQSDNTHYKLVSKTGAWMEWPIEDLYFADETPQTVTLEIGPTVGRSKTVTPKQNCRPKIASTGDSTDYYKIPAWATELRHLMQHKNMNFDVGNIFKASYRLGEKEGIDHEYDLMKIIFFAQSELERIRREK